MFFKKNIRNQICLLFFYILKHIFMYIRHGGYVIINTLTIWHPQGKWFSAQFC
jgi:hypothetical protein